MLKVLGSLRVSAGAGPVLRSPILRPALRQTQPSQVLESNPIQLRCVKLAFHKMLESASFEGLRLTSGAVSILSHQSLAEAIEQWPGASQQLRECRVTARMAMLIPRAPSASRLPVLPLFASSVALRVLPLDCGRLRGLRQGRRLRDPPKRHPRSRELQARWSGPDHACAPGCAARMPAELQAGRFQRQAGPPRPRDLRDPVKHPEPVQARLEGTRDQPRPRRWRHITAHCHPRRRSHEHRGLARQKFRVHCGVAAACRRSSRRVAAEA